MGDNDESIYDGEGDLRKTIVQMRHKRAGETKMMARYGTFSCIVSVLRRQILIMQKGTDSDCKRNIEKCL